ncbi:DinB family protein [Actinoallomurus bryophytorum]|uniref:hypothetical protein n=1 Tax=Actinoallomurus bryophytorum TaxID=1490222 RepID=UPI00163956C1
MLVHHVDLQVGVTPDHWPADFVAHELNGVTAALTARENAPAMRLHATDTGTQYEVRSSNDAPVIRGCQASLLAWLMGRSVGDDLIIDSGRVLPLRRSSTKGRPHSPRHGKLLRPASGRGAPARGSQPPRRSSARGPEFRSSSESLVIPSTEVPGQAQQTRQRSRGLYTPTERLTPVH